MSGHQRAKARRRTTHTRRGGHRTAPSISRDQRGVIDLQTTAGNRAVSRLLLDREASPRRRGPNAALDLIVPDFAIRLSPSVVQRIQGLLDAERFQDAIDACVSSCEAIGAVDTGLLLGGRVHYVAGVQGGDTRAAWRTRFQPPSGPWRLALESQQVRLGHSVMSSPAMLHSALLHEWRHVRMNHRWDGAALAAAPDEGRFELTRLPGLDDRGREVWQELDAYCWQIEHAEALGHSEYEIRQLKNNLLSIVGASLSRLDALPRRLADPARRRYRAALARADQLLGAPAAARSGGSS